MSLAKQPGQRQLPYRTRAQSQRLEQLRGIIRAVVRSKKATTGLIMVGLMVLAAILAPLLTPFDPADMRAAKIFEYPSWQHPLGADEFGRDIFSRTLYGIRISLSVSLTVAALSILFGVPLGMLAGYKGGHVGSVIMALADFLFSLPTVLLALVAATILKPGLTTIVVALSIVYTPQFLRLMRGAVLKVSQQEFVEAARAVGVGHFRIIYRHLLPNVTSLLAVQTALVLSFVILDEAALSFIGVGTQPPTPSWGIMLREGLKNLYRAEHLSVFPGIAVTYAVLAFNLLGDGLQDVFDPRLSRTKKA